MPRSRSSAPSGTYVRTLVTDLGDAYCEELERTAIGPFRLEDAGGGDARFRGSTSSRSATRWRSCRSASLSAEEAAAVAHGRRIPATGEHTASTTRLTHEGELLAIAEPREGEFQPVVVFAPA